MAASVTGRPFTFEDCLILTNSRPGAILRKQTERFATGSGESYISSAGIDIVPVPQRTVAPHPVRKRGLDRQNRRFRPLFQTEQPGCAHGVSLRKSC